MSRKRGKIEESARSWWNSVGPGTDVSCWFLLFRTIDKDLAKIDQQISESRLLFLEGRDFIHARLESQRKLWRNLQKRVADLEKQSERPEVPEPRARDRWGNWHTLRRGLSVIGRKGSDRQSVFHHRTGAKDWGHLVYWGQSELDEDLTWQDAEKSIWRFDLDSPEDE